MKKLYYNLVLTLVAAVLAVGCTEDLTGDVNGTVAGSDFEYIEVTAGLESAESRTTLTDSGNGGKMTWSAGDAIGAIGCTGYAYGNHLHFEVRVDGQHTNPSNYVSINN